MRACSMTRRRLSSSIILRPLDAFPITPRGNSDWQAFTALNPSHAETEQTWLESVSKSRFIHPGNERRPPRTRISNAIIWCTLESTNAGANKKSGSAAGAAADQQHLTHLLQMPRSAKIGGKSIYLSDRALQRLGEEAWAINALPDFACTDFEWIHLLFLARPDIYRVMTRGRSAAAAANGLAEYPRFQYRADGEESAAGAIKTTDGTVQPRFVIRVVGGGKLSLVFCLEDRLVYELDGADAASRLVELFPAQSTVVFWEAPESTRAVAYGLMRLVLSR